jgi:hypothetical protein
MQISEACLIYGSFSEKQSQEPGNVLDLVSVMSGRGVRSWDSMVLIQKAETWK